MRRPLLWVTLCYVGGLAAGEIAFYLPLTTLIVFGTTAVIVMRLISRLGGGLSRREFFGSAAALFIGLAWTYLTLAALEHPPAESWRDRGPIELTGRVGGLPEVERNRTVVLLDVESVARPDEAVPSNVLAHVPAPVQVQGRVRLTIRDSSGEKVAVHSGDRLRVTAELRRPYGLHNVGLFDAGRYAQRRGIVAAASVRADQLNRLGESNGLFDRYLFRPIEEWRARIERAMAASLSPPSAALLSALILGDTHRLTPEVREAFAAAGVAHLLSVSGSHLALLAGVIFLLVRGVCRLLPERWLLRMTLWFSPTQLATLATVPAVIWYTLLAGGRTATIRSLLMLLLYCGAVLLSRPHDLLTALAVAALAVLVADPLALGSISFQLSYGAVLGMGLVLLWWSERVADERRVEAVVTGSGAEAVPWWRPWLQRGQLYLLLTIAATAATAPLVLYHFRQFSWVGLVSNLVLPLLGVVVIPLGLLSAGLTLLFSLSTFPLASLNDWVVTTFTAVISWFARWPDAIVHLPAPSPLTVLALYSGMAALVWGRRIRVVRWLGAATCALWAVAALAGLLRPDGELRVSFLDVGQGDAAVITFPDGRSMVIDGGPQYGTYDTGRAVVAPYLWDHLGIMGGLWGGRIDYLVASHPQSDHIGGQIALLRLFPVDQVWHNGVHRGGMVAGLWRQAAAEGSDQMTVIRAVETPIRIGEVQIDLLHPSEDFVPFVPDGVEPSGHGLNDSAIVMRVGLGGHRFLFTGDIERPAEAELVRTEADRLASTILKVPHHGSRTSSTPAFLDAVHPSEAVISVGAYNPYHHPSSPVLETYEDRGVDVLRTDQSGEVVYLTDGTTLRRFTARELEWRPVLHLHTALDEEWTNYRRLWLRWWWRI
jgi:competence protein ComEC